MDSIKINYIGQDLQDDLDRRAFGPRVSRREKTFIPLNFEGQRSVFNQGHSACKSCLPCEIFFARISPGSKIRN